MTYIKCSNPNCVFHPRGWCVQSHIKYNENGCMDALTEDEYKEIVIDEVKPND